MDDPVHLWDVQPSSCYVSTEQNARICVAELEEGGGAFGLLLLALSSGESDIDRSAMADDAKWERWVMCSRSRLTWMAITGRSM